MTNVPNDGKPQNLYELSWNYAQDGKVSVDTATGIILHANPAMEALTGYSRAELVGMQVAMLHPESEREEIRVGIRQEMTRSEPHFDLHIERKDGSVAPVAIWSSKELNLAGRTLVIAEFRDISASKDAEQRLVVAVDAAQLGTWELDLVNDTSIRNPRHDQIFGYQSPLAEWGSEIFLRHVEPDDRDKLRQAFAKAFECGRLFFESRIVWPDKSIHWIRAHGIVQRDPAGKPVTMIGTVADITERKDAEGHLAQMEARYRGLLEAAPDGMVVVNQGGEIVLLNARAESQFGYRRDELLGQKVTNIIPEGFAERLIADGTRTATEALAQQIGTGIELNGRRKDGTEFPIEIMLSPLENDEGILVTAAVRDITLKREREHQLTAQNWALEAYAMTALALSQDHSSESLLLQAICAAITNRSVYVLAFVGVAENGPGKPIRVAAIAGRARGFLDGLQLSWSEDVPEGQGPSGICIRTNKLQNMGDSETSDVFAPWRERAMKAGIRSSVSLPLRVEGGWRGLLVIYAATPNAFEAPAIEVFQHLAEQIVHAVHAFDQGRALTAGQIVLANLERQLTDALSAMVAPMIAAMEMRDPYTAGHESRVADIAVAIGGEMGWREGRLHGLRVAAQVHDIGKISIPAEILTKPTRLTAGEWALIREHPETGYTILKDIPFAWPVAEIVRQHHERLDGSGYPRGLKGDEILPEARVLAVADMVEAMASHRPYRPGIDLELVLKQIETEAGSLLDPEAVRVCAALIREKRLVLAALSRR
ncbi:MAG: PAS domain S-box protein [Terracidiphilus sp.]